MIKFLKSWPFLSSSTVQAALALLLAFGVHLTPGETGSIEAAAAALLALLTARFVLPAVVPLVLGLLAAAGAVLVAFKIPGVTSGEVAAIVAVVASLLSGLGHLAVTSKFLAGVRAEERAARRERL